MAIPILIADVEDALYSAVFEGDTTAALENGEDRDGNSFPDGFYAFTVDKDLETKEYFTAQLTGNDLTDIKSVDRQGNVTTGFAQQHRAGAKVYLTDWVAIQRIKALLDGTDDFDPTVHIGYSSAPTGLTGNEFATVAYVLSVVSGGTVAFDQQVVTNQLLGETASVNDVAYFKGADQRWWKADADLTATFDELELGIVKTAGSAGGSTTIARSGPVSGFVGLTAGSKYYLSNTAGGISTSEGTNSVYIGTALSTTVLLFNPKNAELPTAGEKNAMAGGSDFGTPSGSNKFLTEAYLAARQKIDIFTANGTWTKPTGAKMVEVILIGAGGGGGGGGKTGSTTAQAGGAGGGGGGISRWQYPASVLSATEAITVGAGGTAGAAVSISSVGGNGGNGGNTSFGSHLTAPGGQGGQSVGNTGGTGGVGLTFSGTAGGNSAGAAGVGNPGTAATNFAPTGGGGGGSGNAAAAAGGAQSGVITRAGGTGGTAGVAGGAGTSAPANEPSGGTGGGGGGGRASGSSSNGAAGGAGGTYGAGGGGGGGVTQDSPSSGAGGAGGQGLAIVMTYF